MRGSELTFSRDPVANTHGVEHVFILSACWISKSPCKQKMRKYYYMHAPFKVPPAQKKNFSLLKVYSFSITILNEFTFNTLKILFSSEWIFRFNQNEKFLEPLESKYSWLMAVGDRSLALAFFGQPIRRTSRPIRLRHFPHARTKLLASKIYIGLINIDFFHIVMQIFWEISCDTTFTTVNLPIGTVS
jgi:hypothetical protein